MQHVRSTPHENSTYHKIGSAGSHFLAHVGFWSWVASWQGRAAASHLQLDRTGQTGVLSRLCRAVTEGGREGVEYLGHAPGHTCAAAGQTSPSPSPSLDVDRLLQRRSRKVEGMLHRISTCNGMGSAERNVVVMVGSLACWAGTA